MTITCNCFCGATHTVTVDPNGFHLWKSRKALIQDALPTLTTVEREQLISGMCPDCQHSFFDWEEDETLG